MSCQDKSDTSKEDVARKIKQTEELFRLADQKFAGRAASGRSSDPAPSQRRPCPDRMSDFGTDLEEGDENTTWILYVLEDLINFAKSRNHTELEVCLTNAHRSAAKVLGVKGDP